MNGKKRNLRSNNEAVSGVIGAVLLIAIAVTMFTLFQASMVPYWNKQVEAGHIPVVYDEMAVLNSDLEDVATLGITKSSNINLGVRYPDRMIFRNPGPGAAGTLTVEDDVDVTVKISGRAPQTLKSSRITYELIGTANSPKLVYEHGILIRDWGDGNVLGPIPPENHTLYDTSSANIYIPIVNSSSFSMSSLDSKSLSIFPITETETITENLEWIKMNTSYPTVWDKILRDTTNTTASVSGNEITITSNADLPLRLPVIDEAEMALGNLYSGLVIYGTLPSAGCGGGGSGDQVGDYNGTGDGVLSYGSQWWNIPSYAEITKMDITRIIYDEDEKLQNDVILITATDNDGDWWKVIIEFDWNPDEITSIKAKTGSGQTGTHSGTPITLPLSNPVDLLSMSNYDNIFATYFYSGIDADNCLVTYLGDDSSIKLRALIFYVMEIA